MSSRNDRHHELVVKAKAITEREMAVYAERTKQSQIATEMEIDEPGKYALKVR